MTNIKKILATTLSILVVTSGSMTTNAMVAVPNVPHQPFMPPIVGVPTVNSGQLSFKSIKTQIANFFSFSSKFQKQPQNNYKVRSGYSYDPDLKKLVISSFSDNSYNNYKDEAELIEIQDVAEVPNRVFIGWKNLKSVFIAGSVEKIGDQSFGGCCNLTKVNFSKGLKYIDYGAFHGCPIKNLSIPNTVVNIGAASFCAHESETVELPSCIKTTDGLGMLGGLSGKYLKNFTLKSCPNDETPTLKVEDGVLYSADGTELIAYPTAKEDRVFEIPELVEKIHSGAFRGCNNLKKLIIPKKITIEDGLTFNDASFDLFYCEGGVPDYKEPTGRSVFESTNVTVYLSKKYPGTEDFCGSSAGKRVLNENCKIGDSCGKNMLWELDYDGTLNITGTGEMDSYDEGYGSWNNYKDEITSVIIGDGVESIGSYAFEGCVNLQNVNISESVGQIGRGAFNNCTSLANVNFNGLSDLGCSNAFKDCGKLESVNVPECFENNAFCGKNVSKILDHGSCTEPESSSSMESSQSSSESSGSMESSQSSSKLSSSSISEVNLGSKRIELIFSKEDIQISSAEESIKDIIDLDPGQYKITVKVIDDEEVKVTVQFVNEDDLNDFHKKVSECTK